MSDMSFKQAKELVERMEFSEIAINKAITNLEKSSKSFEKSSKNFDKTLKKQDEVFEKIPNADKKMSYMFLLLAVNIGFIFGLIIGKYAL